MIKVKAKDSFNISGYPTVHAGETVELPELTAADLEKAGLVIVLNGDDESAKTSQKSSGNAPENKMLTTGKITNKQTKSGKPAGK